MSNREQERFDESRQRLVDAAVSAGVEPAVVIRIAGFESAGFNPDARPITGNPRVDRVQQFDGVMAMSSAHGYGQFTNATWHDMVRQHGERYGVAGASGMSREETNAPELRTDRDLQAALLAEFTRANVLRGQALGGDDPNANVYALHNLGAGSGARFLEALRENRHATVDTALTPVEIRNNPAIYLDAGAPVTLEAAYARMGSLLARYEPYVEQARALDPEAFEQSPRRVASAVDAVDAVDEAVTPRAGRAAFDNGMFNLGDRGIGVETLQRQLIQAGYTGKDGQPLTPDGDFGANTKHAVEALQIAHGLQVDGKAGMHSLRALADELQNGRPMGRFEDASLGVDPLFQSLRGHVHTMDRSMGRTPDEASDRLAAALCAECRASGINRVDGVVLGQMGTRADAGEYVFAYSGPSERPNDFVGVRTSEAVQTPVEQSLAKAEALQRQQAVEAQQYALAQHQGNDAPVRSMS
jgi:peptidoglycan hydrolase-like protein with peptidoglycan-binding domain